MKYERWLIPETDDAAVEALMDAGYPYLVSTVLASRGVVTPEQAAAHLDRERSLVYSPFLMRDMDKAVARIDRALAGGETIAVFGDYDVDGITSTCLLTDYLRSRGAAVLMHIPRRIEEGYGLGCDAIRALAEQGVTLIVTVDCGITGVEETAFAATLGVDLVITDHHECKDALPAACAVVDPHRPDCGFPFKHLAGVGVALELVIALGGARLESMQSVGQNKHLKLRLQKGHTSFDGIFFSVTPAECGLTVGERVDAAFYLQVNEFRGSRSLQLQLVDLRSAHDPGAREAEQLELCRTLIRGGGVSAKDAAKLLPSREQFVRVWRALECEVDGTLTSPELPFLRRLSAEALGAESFPRTVMCLAVFAERGLVTVERHDKYITLRLTGGKRVDLDASPYLCALREGLDGTKGGSSV